jgi:hypothetical protein
MSTMAEILDILRNETLDDLLSRWHQWQHADRVASGHNSSGTGFQDYRTSRQYDDENGALDAAIENSIMATVQACVDAMPFELRPACYMMARNAAVGVEVFRCRPISQALQDTARAQLLRRLISAGVID